MTKDDECPVPHCRNGIITGPEYCTNPQCACRPPSEIQCPVCTGLIDVAAYRYSTGYDLSADWEEKLRWIGRYLRLKTLPDVPSACPECGGSGTVVYPDSLTLYQCPACGVPGEPASGGTP